MIAKKDLIDLCYYVGHCRNSRVVMWVEDRQVFMYIRSKFGVYFPETIKHPDDEKVYDVFRPFHRIGFEDLYEKFREITTMEKYKVIDSDF